ncbi:glycosyltransferase family 4 protein [bacterium]|nr:glycosyltransferase family 4 protein [bacterium]
MNRKKCPKTILFFSPTGHMGGAEHVLLRMCKELTNYKIVVIMPNEGILAEKLSPYVYKVVFFPRYFLQSGQIFNVLAGSFFLWLTLRLNGVFNVSIIHVNSIFCLYVPIYFGFFGRIKTIVHWADFDMRPGDINLVDWFSHVSILAVSKSIQRDLIKNGVRESKIRLLYNGTDDGCFNMTVAESRDVLNIQKDTFVVGMTGRIDSWKGHLVALQAFSKINIQNSYFIIMGEFYAAKDSGYYQQINDFIDDHRLRKRVLFTGRVENAPSVVQAMDVVLVPSENEPFGLVAIEAMAMKKPVIASNVGGLAEIVVDGETGFLVDSKDSDEWTNAMQKLADDKQLRVQLSNNGYERFRSVFGSNQFIEKLDAYYRTLGGNNDDT